MFIQYNLKGIHFITAQSEQYIEKSEELHIISVFIKNILVTEKQ